MRRIVRADWISIVRAWVLPCLVMPPSRRFEGPPVVDSLGTSPKYAATACALRNRFASSITDTKVAATIKPTPDAVAHRQIVRSSSAIFESFSSILATSCSSPSSARVSGAIVPLHQPWYGGRKHPPTRRENQKKNAICCSISLGCLPYCKYERQTHDGIQDWNKANAYRLPCDGSCG